MCTCSAKLKRIAKPRGSACGSLSGSNGSPVELENRAVTGVEGRVRCGARVSDGFPTHTGQEFLEFLRALAASSQASPSPTPIEKFLSEHPAAFAFVQAPKPSPASFATEAYFAVTAMRFTNASGASRFGRYRILPDAGMQHLDASVSSGKDPDYLFAELQKRIGSGPIGFRIEVQLAEDSDVVDNATVHWPDNRPLAPFGHFTLDAIVPENEAQQKRIIFDPIPRLDGIDPSDDPLLELRAAIYLLSGRRRRAA